MMLRVKNAAGTILVSDNHAKPLGKKDACNRNDGKTGQGRWRDHTLRNRIGFPPLVRYGNADCNGEAGWSGTTMNLLPLH